MALQQLETKWEPTAEQVKLAEVLVNPEDRRSKTEKMNSLGVPRATFYRMIKDKNFLNYMKEQIDAMTDGELPEIWKAHVLKCKRGDIPAIKLFYEMKGMYVERKELEITGANGGPIEVNNIQALNYDDLLQLESILSKTQLTEVVDVTKSED